MGTGVLQRPYRDRERKEGKPAEKDSEEKLKQRTINSSPAMHAKKSRASMGRTKKSGVDGCYTGSQPADVDAVD